MLFFLTQGRKTDDLNKSVVLYSFFGEKFVMSTFLVCRGGGGIYTKNTDRARQVKENFCE